MAFRKPHISVLDVWWWWFSLSVMYDSLQPPPGSSVHEDSPGKNTGVGCHSLLQGIFPTQGSNPGLLNCRWFIWLFVNVAGEEGSLSGDEGSCGKEAISVKTSPDGQGQCPQGYRLCPAQRPLSRPRLEGSTWGH